jgi:hypothetical protein
VPGLHVCYPILVHKFGITDGEHYGEQLNAINSTSPTQLAYFSREHDVEEHGHRGVERGAAQKRRRTEKETKRKANTAPLAPPDPRHKCAFDRCYEAYRMRFGSAPTWGAREAKALQRFLQEYTGITAEEIARRFSHLLASTDRYHADKHGSLVHLLSNFDVFADGPVSRNFSPKEGGLNRAEERDHNNLRAAGLVQ